MKTSVLYISYTGLMEPLGQSQVLQYVTGLATQYRMTLLTFEKPEALRDTSQLAALAEECRAAGVEWHCLSYHHRPRMLATAYDVFRGAIKARQLACASDAQVVHCRSYIASLIGLFVTSAGRAKHIFDMRGFWVDERVDGGIWSRDSLKYRLFKRLERKLFLSTDHVVSLSRAGALEVRRLDYLSQQPPAISVIPTCTNLAIFAPKPCLGTKREEFVLGYVGSAGSWYMFDDVARAVAILFDTYPNARFRVINRAGQDEILATLRRHEIDLSRVDIKAASFLDVANEIAKIDAAIFFIKPVWSKLASSPTRLGEFLACGKPVLANGRVGDVEEDVGDTRTGVVINDMKSSTLRAALERLISMAQESDTPARCRTAAQQRFSLESGVARYAAIYATLANKHAAGDS